MKTFLFLKNLINVKKATGIGGQILVAPLSISPPPPQLIVSNHTCSATPATATNPSTTSTAPSSRPPAIPGAALPDPTEHITAIDNHVAPHSRPAATAQHGPRRNPNGSKPRQHFLPIPTLSFHFFNRPHTSTCSTSSHTLTADHIHLLSVVTYTPPPLMACACSSKFFAWRKYLEDHGRRHRGRGMRETRLRSAAGGPDRLRGSGDRHHEQGRGPGWRTWCPGAR